MSICFVLHGMGGTKDQNEKSTEKMREAYQAVCREELQTVPHVEFIMINWHDYLHAHEHTAQRMELLNLPTCGVLRRFNNHVVSDCFFYFGSHFGQLILNYVAQEMNAIAKKRKDIKHFSIVGHSLGGIIGFDLLSNQPHAQHGSSSRHPFSYPTLSFRPDFFFALGSPIAGAMVQRGQFIEDYEPDCLYYNIFNMYDPLAYRMEPLFNPKTANLPPVLLRRPSKRMEGMSFSYYQQIISDYMTKLPSLPQIPSVDDISKQVGALFESMYSIPYALGSQPFQLEKKKKARYLEDPETPPTKRRKHGAPELRRNSMIVRFTEQASKFFKGFSRSSSPVKEEPDMTEALTRLLPRRIDFYVQESSISNTIHQHVHGLNAHFSYWNNKDLLHFIAEKINTLDA